MQPLFIPIVDDALKKNCEQVKANHFLNAFDHSFQYHSLHSLLATFTWYLSQFGIILIICPFAFCLLLSHMEYESTGMGPYLSITVWQIISTQLLHEWMDE